MRETFYAIETLLRWFFVDGVSSEQAAAIANLARLHPIVDMLLSYSYTNIESTGEW